MPREAGETLDETIDRLWKRSDALNNEVVELRAKISSLTRLLRHHGHGEMGQAVMDLSKIGD